VSSDPNKKKKSVLNHHIQYRRLSILFLISATLVSSSLLYYLLPLAYSQEFFSISNFGRFGREEGQFSSPQGIAVDSSSGNVYVADTGNHRIQVFSSDGTFLSRLGGYGSRDNGTLRSTEGIAVDS